LTTPNSVSDAATIAEMPSTAHSVCVRQPTPTPTAYATASRRPRDMPIASVFRLSGPGAAMTTHAATR